MEAKTKKRKRRIKQLCDLERFEADVAANLEREGNKERRRDKSARNTPSSTWADAKWYGDLREVLKDGTIQQDRRKVEFPPGSDNTGMVMCCDGRFYPPQYVVTGPDGRKYSYDDAQATWADAGSTAITVISDHPVAERDRLRGIDARHNHHIRNISNSLHNNRR